MISIEVLVYCCRRWITNAIEKNIPKLSRKKKTSIIVTRVKYVSSSRFNTSPTIRAFLFSLSSSFIAVVYIFSPALILEK